MIDVVPRLQGTRPARARGRPEGVLPVLVSLTFPLFLFILVLILARIEDRVVPPDLEADADAEARLDPQTERFPLTAQGMRRERAELVAELTAREKFAPRVGNSVTSTARTVGMARSAGRVRLGNPASRSARAARPRNAGKAGRESVARNRPSRWHPAA